MNPSFHPRLWLATLMCALACSAPQAAERGPKQAAPASAAAENTARVIVKFKATSPLMRALSVKPGVPTAGPQQAHTLSARLGVALADGRPVGASAQVFTAQGVTSEELAQRLRAQADVEYAVVDGRKRALSAPNDPLFGNNQTKTTPIVGQWYLRAPTSSTIANADSVVSAINAQAAWDITRGNSGVVVAVLDSGVRLDHPDLASKLLPGYDFIHDAGTAGDGTGRDNDPSDTGDFVARADVGVAPGCTFGDVGQASSWHGTQTAGLIGAATHNGIGMAGSGRDVMLLPVRVLGKCGGYDSDIQAAMLWAAGLSADPVSNPHPAKVVNLSLGSAGVCSASYADIVQQLNAAGVVVVAAAGNDGLSVGTPANCPGVIGVAGVRHSGTKVGYSDLGPQVSIAAPAGNCKNLTGDCLFPLLTTSNSGAAGPVANAAGGSTYTTSSGDSSLGTSFSAPLVSGTVGLMLSANPGLTPSQVLSALQASARPFPVTGAGAGVSACMEPTGILQASECYCTTSTCGAGLLDAGAAVARVALISANIDAPSLALPASSPVQLTAASSYSTSGVITAYQWTLVSSGGATAVFTSATNAASATLSTTGSGYVVVSLKVTDSTGQQSTNSVTLTIGTPAATTPPDGSGTGTGSGTGRSGGGTGGGSSEGGGGGAMELGWLIGWLASVAGVWLSTPRRGQRTEA
jgi:serine protease